MTITSSPRKLSDHRLHGSLGMRLDIHVRMKKFSVDSMNDGTVGFLRKSCANVNWLSIVIKRSIHNPLHHTLEVTP